jgi:hypothetical protein
MAINRFAIQPITATLTNTLKILGSNNGYFLLI